MGETEQSWKAWSCLRFLRMFNAFKEIQGSKYMCKNSMQVSNLPLNLLTLLNISNDISLSIKALIIAGAFETIPVTKRATKLPIAGSVKFSDEVKFTFFTPGN